MNPVISYAALQDYTIAEATTSLTLEVPPEYPVKIVPVYETSHARSLSGLVRGSQTNDGRFSLELTFNLVSADFRDSFQVFLSLVRGGLFPFWYTHSNGNSYFVTLVGDYSPIPSVSVGVYRVAVSLMGKKAGIDRSTFGYGYALLEDSAGVGVLDSSGVGLLASDG